MEERNAYFLYDPQKVIEEAQKVAGLTPVRLFALLVPMWRVELEGTFREQKPYALLEEYFERGLFEGQLQTTEELSAFFGIDPRLVAKVLDFLVTIEHVQQDAGRWYLRPLGQESLREGQKYIAKKNRQEFFFEAFHCQPLTREHYDKLRVYTEQEAEELVKTYERAHRGYRCERLFSVQGWRREAVDELASRADRDLYNLRKEISGVHQAGPVETVYYPLYLIEAQEKSDQRTYLAYSRIRGRRDTFFERMVNEYPEIYRSLLNTASKERYDMDLWTPWLKRQGLANMVPIRMPGGIWQLNLDPALFRLPDPPLALEKIGTYYLENGHFLYLWCKDLEIRRDAALDRALRLIERYKKTITEREVEKHLQLLSDQLATRRLELQDLKQRATSSGRMAVLKVINAL